MQTAIIACLLLGAMFIFTECGDNETKEVAKVEVDEEGIPTYVTEKAIDVSYSERDKEIAAASYTKKEESNANSIPKNLDRETYSLATKENARDTGTSYETRDKEIALASYSAKGKVEAETLVTEKNTRNKEEDVSPKVMKNLETNRSETTPAKTEVVSSIPTVSDVPSAEKITLPTIPNVPEVNVTVPTALKAKSTEKVDLNSQAKKDLNTQ